jgi:hypothetical protein
MTIIDTGFSLRRQISCTQSTRCARGAGFSAMRDSWNVSLHYLILSSLAELTHQKIPTKALSKLYFSACLLISARYGGGMS